MKEWAVFSKDGKGIFISFPHYEEAAARRWMAEHEEAIKDPGNYHFGAYLAIHEYETEPESLRRIIQNLLVKIRAKAQEADGKAADACLKSKYSIQDYWMCLEFWTQRLHDDLAKEAGLPDRCPRFPFRKRLAEFKKSIRAGGLK